ncbi:replication factor C subunit 1 [Elasticomyces elasticus]|nr:replication factor C subunit 1 [Elasticomyces elasticus]
MPTQSHVYTLSRTDYLSSDDNEGSLALISIHGTLSSASKAAQAHLDAQVKSHNLKDPNVKDSFSTNKDGAFRKTVMVGEEDYHSFEIQVTTEELKDGAVIVEEEDEAATTEEAKPAKAPAKGKANGAAKKAAPAKKGKTAKAKTEADEPAEDEDEEVEPSAASKAEEAGSAPKGAANCLSGLSFLITGTLEGFTRKEAQTLIEKYGGAMETTLQKMPDYVQSDYPAKTPHRPTLTEEDFTTRHIALFITDSTAVTDFRKAPFERNRHLSNFDQVLGVKAGPKKLDQIRDLGLETIDQGGLYELIRTKPAKGAKREAEAAPEKEKRTSKRGKKE